MIHINSIRNLPKELCKAVLETDIPMKVSPGLRQAIVTAMFACAPGHGAFLEQRRPRFAG